MLEILDAIVLYFTNQRIYISAFIYEAYVCGTSVVQVQVCSTSNLAGPKAHNIIYVNKNDLSHLRVFMTSYFKEFKVIELDY